MGAIEPVNRGHENSKHVQPVPRIGIPTTQARPFPNSPPLDCDTLSRDGQFTHNMQQPKTLSKNVGPHSINP